jgi:flagellar protein FlaJ
MLSENKGDQKKKDQGRIIGFTKPKKFLFFKIKSRPIYEKQSGTTPAYSAPEESAPREDFEQELEVNISAGGAPTEKKYNAFQRFIAGIAARHKDLDLSLKTQNIKGSSYDFIKKMFFYSLILSVVVTVVLAEVLIKFGLSIIFAIIVGLVMFWSLFNKFIQYPVDRSRNVGKEVEKDIIFAARDIVIGMRSGMPLYNAITAVSTGYGAASKEFVKIVELVQLGTPIEEAMDRVSSKSESKTFKRIMLQATVSIKSGADIVGALQSTLDELGQERVIELRRYGQRLNVLAMFYMLFGVIFPSMGIAVAAILTTFISIFTVDESTLIMALVGMAVLQLIFLNVMRTSRPSYAM